MFYLCTCKILQIFHTTFELRTSIDLAIHGYKNPIQKDQEVDIKIDSICTNEITTIIT